MKRQLIYNKFFITAMIILVIIFLHYTTILSPVERIITIILSPFQTTFYSITQTSSQSISNVITKKDWVEIYKLQSNEYDITIASKSLVKTKEYYEKGHLTEAFIQGHTTIELVLEEFVRNRIKEDDE